MFYNQDKIIYKYDGKKETEIKSWNEKTQQMDKSIQLSQETLQALFGNDNGGSLSFDRFVNNPLAITTDTTLDNIKGILFTGENTKIKIGSGAELILGSTSQENNSVFATIGIDLRDNDSLVENYGKITINTDYVLFVGNIVHEKDCIYLFGNHFYSTPAMNSKFITIQSNTITLEEESSYLVGDKGTATFSSELLTKTLTFKGNEVKGKKSAYLFHNDDNSILNLNGEIIVITDNTISPTELSKDDKRLLFFIIKEK